MGTNRLHWPETPMLPTIRLKDKAERRLKGGHLWVYSNEVDTAATPLKGLGAGAEAVIETSAGKPLGRAVVSPEQLICARLYTRDASQPLDASFIVHRLKIALSARELWYPEQCYRWVYGDSDSLPGLVIDRFMDVVVVQISSAAMEERRQDILDAINKVVKPACIVLKNNGKLRAVEKRSRKQAKKKIQAPQLKSRPPSAKNGTPKGNNKKKRQTNK